LLKVLIVAAERLELRGILRLCSSARREPVPAAAVWSGQLSGNHVWLAAAGAGPRLAARAADAPRQSFDVVVSTGLCGALDPALHFLDVFAATRVNDLPALMPHTHLPFESGPLLSTDRFIGSAEERLQLSRSGARAVEMEAAAVAEFAAARHAAFYCIRAVSDIAAESFRIDFNSARGAEGGFSRSRIALQVIRRPLAAGELIAWAHRGRRASDRLGEFLANCRF
jgi:nucleoside phosphorylase